MDGLPVTVRLLDPPLHEFLPSIEELTSRRRRRARPTTRRACSPPPSRGHEFNPMLGTRGVRLGVVKPGLYAMQVRALMEAAASLRRGRQDPVVEIMIPLTVTREELRSPALGRGRDRRRPARG